MQTRCYWWNQCPGGQLISFWNYHLNNSSLPVTPTLMFNLLKIQILDYCTSQELTLNLMYSDWQTTLLDFSSFFSLSSYLCYTSPPPSLYISISSFLCHHPPHTLLFYSLMAPFCFLSSQHNLPHPFLSVSLPSSSLSLCFTLLLPISPFPPLSSCHYLYPFLYVLLSFFFCHHSMTFSHVTILHIPFSLFHSPSFFLCHFSLLLLVFSFISFFCVFLSLSLY